MFVYIQTTELALDLLSEEFGKIRCGRQRGAFFVLSGDDGTKIDNLQHIKKWFVGIPEPVKFITQEGAATTIDYSDGTGWKISVLSLGGKKYSEVTDFATMHSAEIRIKRVDTAIANA